MDEWEKFDETLPLKEDFYSNLNMEGITDSDYNHAKRVFKDCEIKNLDKYHDLYLKSNTLLLAIVLAKVIYELDLTKFLSALGLAGSKQLAWPAALKKNKVDVELLTDIDVLLMVEKRIRGRRYPYVTLSVRYAKTKKQIYENL